MNIAFYVSGNATRLKKIFKEERIKNISESVKLIFTDNIFVENLSDIRNSFNINIKGVEYSQLKPNRNNELSKILLNEFLKNEIDYCFCFGDHILKGELLEKYENRIINFHPSILPMYPGRKAIDQAIADNSSLYGNTAHFIDKGVDTGAIIMQNIIYYSQINFDDKYESILNHQIDMFFQIYNWLNKDRIAVVNGVCKIKNSTCKRVAFFPELDNE